MTLERRDTPRVFEASDELMGAILALRDRKHVDWAALAPSERRILINHPEWWTT